MEFIRKQIEDHTTARENVPTSVDLPVSNEGKRVLAYTAEKAERLSHEHIGTEHLLLSLLREEKCFAAEILHERGLQLSNIRVELGHTKRDSFTRFSPVAPPQAIVTINSTLASADLEVDGEFPGKQSIIPGKHSISCAPRCGRKDDTTHKEGPALGTKAARSLRWQADDRCRPGAVVLMKIQPA